MRPWVPIISYATEEDDNELYIGKSTYQMIIYPSIPSYGVPQTWKSFSTLTSIQIERQHKQAKFERGTKKYKTKTKQLLIFSHFGTLRNSTPVILYRPV